MVKAYKDNFLMSSASTYECLDGYYCNASIDDQIAELEKIAGSDTSTVADSKSTTDVEVPAFDYDLEAELSKVFNKTEPEMPGVEAADAGSVDAVVETAAPSMELGGMIEDEFDKALSEQAEMLKEEVALETAAPAPAPAATPEAVVETTTEEKNSAFAEQLAQLLSEPDAVPAGVEPVSVPDIVAEAAEPVLPELDVSSIEMPDMPVFDPETVAATDFAEPKPAAVYEAAPVEAAPVVPTAPQPAPVEFEPVEFEPIEPGRDYSDPAADYQSFAKEVPAAPVSSTVIPEHFKPAFDSKPIESVLGASAALGAAATAASSYQSDEPVNPLPPVSTLETQETTYAAQEETPFAEPFPQFDDELVIPEADIIAAAPASGAGGRKVAFVILAIALLGGVGALASNYFTSGSGDTPVLMADGGSVKVKPKEAGGQVVPNQDQAVYKTVNGNETKIAQTTLKNNVEQPINVARVEPAKQETRVTNSTSNAGSESNEEKSARPSPRSVRTVVVKPDGTIVSSFEDKVDTSGVNLGRLAPEGEVSAAKVKTVKLAPSETPAKPSLKGKIENIMPKSVISGKPVAVAKDAVKVAKLQPQVKKLEVKPVEVKKVAAPKPQKVAVAKPVKKVAAKKPEPAALPRVKSPYAVQISSRRTPASAKEAWRKLSRKHASLLGGVTPDIQKTDIKGKGIYYRVRVPASNKAKAQSICSKLKAAGGSCFVTR